MNKHDVDTALCVLALIVAGPIFQGCGGGEPIVVDGGINTADPCSVCKDPHAQGPDAGDLNNGDFTNFCNSPKCQPDGTKSAADAVKEANALVHETDKSPSLCDVCNRPDAQGHYAGELNDDDFIVQCVKHCPGFKHPGPAMQMAAQQMNNTQGASRMLIVSAAGLFLLMTFFALKRVAAKKQTLLAGYSDAQADDGYVRVEA